MGLRQAFGRRRKSNSDAAAAPPAPAPAPRSRHSADPATGELRRVHEPRPEPQPEPRPELQPEAQPEPLPVIDPVIDPVVRSNFGPATSYGPPTSYGPKPPEVRQPATPPGGLVVGNAQRRTPETVMPATYSRNPLPYDRTLVRHAFDLVAERADKLVRNFYAELFSRLGDEAFAMFPASMSAQRQDFGKALVQWVVTDDPDAMAAHLSQLGADHRKFAVAPRHYDVAGEALVSAWRGLLGEQWTSEIERAVLGSYTRLASTMIDGAMARSDEPASWGAQVVAHERVHRDFAVLRVQPDGPYTFRPGQYLTVELAQRPKEWRRMSIASAPRPDNTLDLHVRSVNATGVAAAMVMHTEAGDRLRLGPPRGNDLVVEPGTLGPGTAAPGGLLCIAAGTGEAPMAAVVEALLQWPQVPQVYVFTGARTAADLYPAELLARTVEAAGCADQVQIYGVVAQDPSYTGLRGKVEDVVPTLKDWAQLGVEVLIAGPDTMIQTTIFGLVGRGVPSRMIHFDQYDTTE